MFPVNNMYKLTSLSLAEVRAAPRTDRTLCHSSPLRLGREFLENLSPSSSGGRS